MGGLITAQAMLALSSPELARPRERYRSALDEVFAAADFDERASSKLKSLGRVLSMPAALEEKLGLDAYYGWLLDLSEVPSSRSHARTPRLRVAASCPHPDSPPPPSHPRSHTLAVSRALPARARGRCTRLPRSERLIGR